jgi:hypothetical protein
MQDTQPRLGEILKIQLRQIENVGKMSANESELGARLEGFEPTTPGSES